MSDSEVIAAVDGLAAALRAGLTPQRAFEQVARSVRTAETQRGRATVLDGVLAQLAAQAAAGAHLEPLLRAAARGSGSEGLAAMAAGFAMAERHGAPIVDVLDGLGSALREAARTAAAVESALAAPRATARLLGVLPIGGVLLGELVGVHPLGVLVGTPLGRAALVVGLLFTWCGRVWMRRLVRSVERG